LLLFFPLLSLSIYLSILLYTKKDRKASQKATESKKIESNFKKTKTESKNPKIIFTCLNQKAKSNPPPSVSLSHG
jgi:hypothetical protein